MSDDPKDDVGPPVIQLQYIRGLKEAAPAPPQVLETRDPTSEDAAAIMGANQQLMQNWADIGRIEADMQVLVEHQKQFLEQARATRLRLTQTMEIALARVGVNLQGQQKQAWTFDFATMKFTRVQ